MLHSELDPPACGLRTQVDPEPYHAELPVKETIPVGAAPAIEETMTVQTVDDSCSATILAGLQTRVVVVEKTVQAG
jgi:hypothetical protein